MFYPCTGFRAYSYIAKIELEIVHFQHFVFVLELEKSCISRGSCPNVCIIHVTIKCIELCNMLATVATVHENTDLSVVN